MSLENSQNYDLVKEEVLKAYEWVPERYRVKFRTWRKEDKKTYTEFVKEQKMWYDRWVTACNIGDDIKKLEQLILLEQFKDSIHPSIKMFLDEREIKFVEDAARIADNYVLTHKNFYKYRKTPYSKMSPKKSYRYSKSSNNGSTEKVNLGGSSIQEEWVKTATCYKCGKIGHISRNCGHNQN